jgi:ribosome biogenesis GTPase
VLVDEKRIECRLGGRLRLDDIKHTNPVSVGDIVIIGEEKGDDFGSIVGIVERKNYLIRKATNLSKQTHIVAANIDQIIILATLKMPRTSTGFIDRILVTCEAYHIPAIIVFNKKDLLVNDELNEVNNYRESYENLVYSSYIISAKAIDDIRLIMQIIRNKVTLITGHSGVGKSSLLNAINPSFTLRTGNVSEKFKKGTHTTTFAEMHPLIQGGFIIDTPGIKEFGLVEMDKYEIRDYFPEFFKLKPNCKFNNCLHVNEPECAVLKALDEGEIKEFRYLNYINMLETNEE